MLVQWQPLGLLLTQISLFRGNNLGFLLYSCLLVSTTNALFLKGSMLSEARGSSVLCDELLCVYESFSMWSREAQSH